MHTQDQELERLTHLWQDAKQKEREATERRISVESAIYELVGSRLPEKGTTNFETGLKIVTGFSESWDQERLQEAYQTWPLATRFPFHAVWEPDGKAITYLRENQPELYRMLGSALTLKPKKPAFSVKG